MKLTEAVSKRLTELAKENDLNLSEWSIRSGLTPSTVYGAKNRKKGCPRLQTIKYLCDTIKITLPEFFNVDYIISAENDVEKL